MSSAFTTATCGCGFAVTVATDFLRAPYKGGPLAIDVGDVVVVYVEPREEEFVLV